MSNFDLAATVAHVDAAAQPKGNFGCVYELWQEARNREAYGLLGSVPDAHYDETVAALKDKGVIVELDERPEGLCVHWLDAMTCPRGCFENDEPEPDWNEMDDRELDPAEESDIDDKAEEGADDEADWDMIVRMERDRLETAYIEVESHLTWANAKRHRLGRELQITRVAVAAMGLLAVIGWIG